MKARKYTEQMDSSTPWSPTPPPHPKMNRQLPENTSRSLTGRRQVRSTLILSAAALFLILSAVFLHAEAGSTDEFKILFVGDTSFGENYQERLATNILKEKGYDYPLEKLQPLLKSSNLVIANLESPITNVKESPFEGAKSYLHWMDVEKAPASLMKHGITHVNLANNHTLDFGAEGLKQTLEIFRKNGISWFGAGLDDAGAALPFVKTVTVGSEPFTLVVIGAMDWSRRYDEKYDFYAAQDKAGVNKLTAERITTQIQAGRKKWPKAFLVVFPHWLENYKWKTEAQTALCRRMIDAGADMVIGSGAHMMQEIEFYKGQWIIYGLGNFMFNSPGRSEKLAVDPFSLAAQLIVKKEDGHLAKTLKLYPIFTNNRADGYQTRVLNDEEFQKACNLLVEKSTDPVSRQTFSTSGSDDIGHYLTLPITP